MAKRLQATSALAAVLILVSACGSSSSSPSAAASAAAPSAAAPSAAAPSAAASAAPSAALRRQQPYRRSKPATELDTALTGRRRQSRAGKTVSIQTQDQ